MTRGLDGRPEGWRQDMAGHKEVDQGWQKSSASGDGHCVEVRVAVDAVRIRDDKDREGPVLAFTHDEWSAFLTGVRLGEFDIPAPDRPS